VQPSSESLAAIVGRLFERNDELVIGREASNREIARLREQAKTWKGIALQLAHEIGTMKEENNGIN